MPERTPRLGSGVELQPDGVVRALRAGRVVYNPGWIDVVESLVHERSLAAADGYLFFPGDVVIRGDVLEGVQVVAGGCVFVGGSVSGAKISGEAGIVVTGGVFASTLRAGMGKAVQQDLREKLSSFTAEAEQFVLGAEQVEQALRQRGAHVSFGAVCDRLLTDKYVSFQSWPNQLADWLTRHNGAVHAQWVALVQRIQQDFSPGRLRLAQGAHELRQKLDELRVQCDRLLDGEHHIADIEVRYAQNSVLSASGSITARQKGFYQCRMEAGRAIEARGSGGIILGGMASAASVVAREIGSELGGATEIHLSEHGTVQAEVIHPDTVLCIEGVQHRVNRPMRRAKWP
ncbi:hypothetical protein GCM10025857_09650 [Alicyclobacillus contaminans]|nr:hypothetical protein GCM10025857_09650 [Alicyclobacillus contaminans]